MFADLHIHTYYSDSTRSPAEVVDLAKQRGFGIISVCDHNNVYAYDELIPICRAEGVLLITGVEIQALFQGKEYHLLGYGFDFDSKAMTALQDYTSKILVDRGYQLIEKMSNDYRELSLAEFNEHKRNPNNGGWESIDYLRSKKLVQDFTEYLAFCRKYHVTDKNSFKSISEVAEVIHNANGKVICAHPGDMIDNSYEIFNSMLPKLLAQGIDGFECYYTSHKSEVTKMLSMFCKANDLLITAGSDDHGDFNSVIDGVEYYIGAVKIDTEKLNLKGLV